MSPSWILVVDAGRYDVAALFEAVRSAAEPLGPVSVEELGGRLVLRVPVERVHPAAVAVQLPAVLAGDLAGAPDPVWLVIDQADSPDRALRLVAALHGPAADPPLAVALTDQAWHALSRGDDPVPLRDFGKVTIYGEGVVLQAWIRTPDDVDTSAAEDPGWDDPAAPADGGAHWGGPDEGVLGPPPGPDFPTDR